MLMAKLPESIRTLRSLADVSCDPNFLVLGDLIMMGFRKFLPKFGANKSNLPSLDVLGSVAVDTDRPLRIGLWALLAGVLGFLLWASFAPLDEGVPAQATVSIDTKRKTIQHALGGIVRAVYVKEGQKVQANQVLMALDSAETKATYESVKQHYLGMRAMEGRLLAEQLGKDKIEFHPDVVAGLNDPAVKQQVDTQQQLFLSRKLALASELDGIQESIGGLRGQVDGYKGLLDSRKSQLQSLREQIASMSELFQEGYAPKNKLLELRRSEADINASISETTGNVIKAQKEIASNKAKLIQLKLEARKDADSQLAEVRREVQADADKLAAARDTLSRVEIRAPVKGQVIGLNVQTVGAVVQPGQKIMDIVPDSESLVLEAKIPPNLIDRVRSGMMADVRFSAFSHTPQLVVEGHVDSVSGDLLTDGPNGQGGNGYAQPYYLARVSVTGEGLKDLGAHRHLQPGMPAEVVIKTGERSLLKYWISPLIKRMTASLKEE